MSEFINTIDVLGDDAVVDSIIQRTITEFKDDQVTEIGEYAFYGCDKLESVCVPNVTEIRKDAFRKCVSLKAITDDSFPKVTSFSYYHGAGTAPFGGCISLESVVWPSLEEVYTVGLWSGCTSLKSVDLPNFTTMGYYAISMFEGCKLLENANLPKLLMVMSNTFKGCAALKTIKLPSVTACYENNNFYGCSALKIIDLPVCASIGGRYFARHSTSLIALILRSPMMCTLADTTCTFYDTPIESGTGYIYVPRALIEDYKAATNWSIFATQLRALEDYTVDGTTTGELDETKI